MKTLLKIKDVLNPLHPTEFIFKALDELEVPWKDEDIAEDLDLLYLGDSSHRNISPLVELIKTGSYLSQEDLQKLAKIIYAKFGRNWTELYKTLLYEYDPIVNYDATETETINTSGESSTSHTDTNTGTSTHTDATTEEGEKTIVIENTGTVTDERTNTGTVTDAKTNTGTVTDEKTNTGTVSNAKTNTGTTLDETTQRTENDTTEVNKVVGFNSTTPVTSDTKEIDNTVSSTGSVTHTDNLSENSTRTDNLSESSTRTDDTRTDNVENIDNTINSSGSETVNGSSSGSTSGTSENLTTRELRRKGNIGVMTTQQLIREQRELWNFNFFCRVVNDINSLLTLDIY